MKKQRKTGAHEVPRPERERSEWEKRREARREARQKTAAQPPPRPRGAAHQAPRPPRPRRRLRILHGRARWFLIATLAAVLALAVLAAWQMSRRVDVDYDSEMALARECYQSRDYETALRHLRRAAPLGEGDEASLLMADCYEAQGNLEKALEILRGLDVNETQVAQRIERIDRQRTALQEAEKISVLGLRFDADTTDLVMDGMDVRDNELAEIQQLYALNNLSLMNNRLTDISPLAKLGGLDTLNLSGNAIADISPLSALTDLRTLYLDDNPITDFTPLYPLQHLNTLSIRGIPISAEQLTALSEALPGCAIHSDPVKEEKNQSAADITIGGVTFKSDVRELDLSGLGIRDIGALSGCAQLQWLKLANNEIADLTALMNLPELQELDVSGNALSDLRPLMGVATLRKLNAAGNQLMDTAAVGTMENLTVLDLSGNPITDFSGLAKLKNLQSLSLENVGLTDEALPWLEKLPLLGTLDLQGNEGLSDEAMGRLKSMLPTCTILHADLVYTAVIGGQEFPSTITELDLQGQGLTDLGNIDRLSNLETVRLSQNELSNIYLLQYCAGRAGIRLLDLSYNKISDITPLAYLGGLEELDLSGNPLSTLQPLTGLKSLKTLRVAATPLTREQLDAFAEACPNVTILEE